MFSWLWELDIYGELDINGEGGMGYRYRNGIRGKDRTILRNRLIRLYLSSRPRYSNRRYHHNITPILDAAGASEHGKKGEGEIIKKNGRENRVKENGG